MEPCPLCEAKGGRYNFNLICCRVRYLLVLPSKEMRLGWLDRWQKRDGSEMVKAIKAAAAKQVKEQQR